MSPGQNGRILVKCHAGCDLKSILASLGLRRSDLFDGSELGAYRQKSPNKPQRQLPKVKERRRFASLRDALKDIIKYKGMYSDSWTYQDREGRDVGVVLRWDGPDGKDIRPISLYGDYWEFAAMEKPRPLYRLPDIIKEPRVLVVEGEKSARAAWNLGFPCTTSSNGSQSAAQTDWTPLLAGKQIFILPDNDSPGRHYAREVCKILRYRPYVLQLPGLPEGGDLADWVEMVKNPARKLKKLMASYLYM